MLPFERLRALARTGIDDTSLVLETADCLSDFGPDPTQLLTVCRRLLAYHPRVRAVVVAVRGRRRRGRSCWRGACDAARRIESDRTATRLASLLPFPHDDPVAVLGWPEVAGRALAERPDLDLVVIRARRRDTGGMARLRALDRSVRVVDETEAIALAPTHLFVEVAAMSPTTALVDDGVADVLWSLPQVKLWFVAGRGRLLPPRLFDVLRAEVARQELDYEELDAERAQQVAGPDGLTPPERLATRLDCPVAPELLRL